jgi:hypothetical protein
LQPTRRTLRRFSGHDTRGSLERYTPYIEAFQRGLREWGYVKIRNIIIEYRMVNVQNPVETGYVASLTRPGGTTTW